MLSQLILSPIFTVGSFAHKMDSLPPDPPVTPVSSYPETDCRRDRREFLMAAGYFLFAGALAAAAADPAVEQWLTTPHAYPRVKIARLGFRSPLTFAYPLEKQVSILLDLGHPVRDGAYALT